MKKCIRVPKYYIITNGLGNRDIDVYYEDVDVGSEALGRERKRFAIFSVSMYVCMYFFLSFFELV